MRTATITLIRQLLIDNLEDCAAGLTRVQETLETELDPERDQEQFAHFVKLEAALTMDRNRYKRALMDFDATNWVTETTARPEKWLSDEARERLLGRFAGQ